MQFFYWCSFECILLNEIELNYIVSFFETELLEFHIVKMDTILMHVFRATISLRSYYVP